jgi:hypothetical protein
MPASLGERSDGSRMISEQIELLPAERDAIELAIAQE